MWVLLSQILKSVSYFQHQTTIPKAVYVTCINVLVTIVTGHDWPFLRVWFCEQVKTKCLTCSTLRPNYNTKITWIWRRINNYLFFCLNTQVYLTTYLPLHGTEFILPAALIPWLCPRAVLTWKLPGQLGCWALHQNKDSFESIFRLC